MNYKNLGLYQLYAIFIAFSVSGVVASYFVNTYGIKPCMVIGTAAFTLFILAGNLAVNCKDSTLLICSRGFIYTSILITAAICGFAAGVIWLANSTYIDQMVAKTPNYRGRYYGNFFSLFSFQALIGIGLSALLLGVFSKQIFYIIMALLICVATILITKVEVDENQTQKLTNTQQSTQEQVSIMDSYRKFIKLLSQKEMQTASYYFALSGLSIGVYCGFQHVLVENALQLEQNEVNDKIVSFKTTLTLLFLGGSEIIGAYISGKLADKDKSSTYFLCNIGSNIGILAMISVVFTYYMKSYTLCFVTISLLGLAEFFSNTLASVIITDDFGGCLEGFMIYRVMQGSMIIIILGVQLLLSSCPIWIYFLIILMVSIIINIKVFELKKPEKTK